MLESKGNLRLIPVRTGRRGAAAVLAALTDRAVRLLHRPQPPGQTSRQDAVLRAYHRKQIADWAVGRGWQAEIPSDDEVADV